MTRKSFQQSGAGEIIRFAIGGCSLGSVLVAASEKGVCAVSMGDNPDQLSRDLQKRFPKAQLAGGGKKFAHTVAKVIGFVEAPKLGFGLPLDVRGTEFQRRIWKALLKIPVGTTMSYAAIAKRIGSPKAVRAVAGACASNAIAVVIPCHRVVRADGNISGYRWGVERKRSLLQMESAAE